MTPLLPCIHTPHSIIIQSLQIRKQACLHSSLAQVKADCLWQADAVMWWGKVAWCDTKHEWERLRNLYNILPLYWSNENKSLKYHHSRTALHQYHHRPASLSSSAHINLTQSRNILDCSCKDFHALPPSPLLRLETSTLDSSAKAIPFPAHSFQDCRLYQHKRKQSRFWNSQPKLQTL